MAHILDIKKLKEKLKPMGVKSRGLYMSKAIQDIIDGDKSYDWIKDTTLNRKVKAPKEYSEQFEAFWAVYHPRRKQAKRKVWDAWFNAADGNQDALLLKCITALQWQRELDSWKEFDGKYFRQAQTWVNQAGWEDEDPNEGVEWEEYLKDNGEIGRRRIE